MKTLYVFLMVMFINYFKVNNSHGKVELYLLYYKNLSMRLADGKCCGRSCRSCKYIMQVCLSSISAKEACSYVKKTSPKMFENEVELTYVDMSGNGVGSAFVYDFTQSPEEVYLKIEVVSVEDELIARFEQNVDMKLNDAGKTGDKHFDLIFNSKNKRLDERKELKIKMRSFCGEDYLSPHCVKQRCKERDDDYGHYRCIDSRTKVCLIGWKDVSRNCTIKIPLAVVTSSLKPPPFLSSTNTPVIKSSLLCFMQSAISSSSNVIQPEILVTQILQTTIPSTSRYIPALYSILPSSSTKLEVLSSFYKRKMNNKYITTSITKLNRTILSSSILIKTSKTLVASKTLVTKNSTTKYNLHTTHPTTPHTVLTTVNKRKEALMIKKAALAVGVSTLLLFTMARYLFIRKKCRNNLKVAAEDQHTDSHAKQQQQIPTKTQAGIAEQAPIEMLKTDTTSKLLPNISLGITINT